MGDSTYPLHSTCPHVFDVDLTAAKENKSQMLPHMQKTFTYASIMAFLCISQIFNNVFQVAGLGHRRPPFGLSGKKGKQFVSALHHLRVYAMYCRKSSMIRHNDTSCASMCLTIFNHNTVHLSAKKYPTQSQPMPPSQFQMFFCASCTVSQSCKWSRVPAAELVQQAAKIKINGSCWENLRESMVFTLK